MEFKKIFVEGSVVKKADGSVDWEKSKPAISHLRVRRMTKRWILSPTMLMAGLTDGYFAMSNVDGVKQLAIKTADGTPDVVYRFVLEPGHYCCHCNKKLNDSKDGRAHVDAEHAGVPSPDDNNPHGWRCDNHYTLECVSGGDPKPEVAGGGRMRYFKQQEERRAGARAKIQARDAAAMVAAPTNAPPAV